MAYAIQRPFVLAIVLAPLLSCGTSGDDLFGKSSGGDTTNGQGGTGAVGATGGTTSVGGSPTTGGEGGRGPGPSSASSSQEASSSSVSSSTGTMEQVVECGGVTCPVGGQNACCWDNYKLNGPPQGECVKGPPEGDNCNTEVTDGNTGLETRIECQIPAHCTMGVCCGDRIVVNATTVYYAS